MSAPVSADEAARLAALDALEIVGTPAEPVFDSIVQLLARMTGTPIALLSLVTRDEQWFKANVGLAGIQSTPRDISFCTHAVANRDMLIVNDATCDPRFASNPLVTDFPRIRFYAGAPLITSRGHALGTLCAIDREPRNLTREQRITLQQLAAIVTALIEARADKKALKASEARLQEVFAAMAEGIVVQARDGRITDANQAAETVLGLTREELIGKKSVDSDWHAIREDGTPFPGQDHPAMVTLRTGAPVHRQIMGVRNASDAPRWISINSQPLLDEGTYDGAPAVICTFVDVTSERRAFEQIRALAQRLETAREEERRSIAQSLHEGIAQDLFAMRLTLQHLHSESKGRAGVQQAYAELASALDQCMADTRQVANDLHPAALAHISILAVLQAHASYFGTLAGLKIEVNEVAPFPWLEESTGLVLFRVAQEALTNIARHSQAAHVRITLRAAAEQVWLEVADDGIGMQADAIHKPGSLGLLGIRERLAALGGAMLLEPNVPRGTTLRVCIPVAKAERSMVAGIGSRSTFP